MAKFDIRNWRQLNEDAQAPQKRMTESEKRETLEAVSNFNKYSRNIYKTQEITEMVENIKTLSENASRMVIEETADWFDAVSVKRDTKSIGEAVKIFEGTAREMTTLQQRLESVFEDIGGKLGKYYEIKELSEDDDEDDAPIMSDPESQIEETEAQDKYQAKFKAALKNAGVESPAELDDEEKKDFFNKIDKMHKAKDEGINKFKNQVTEAFEGLSNVISPPGYVINMIQKTKNINEGFETWLVRFADMNLSGIELRAKNEYRVTARTTIEAIKKASKMAGLKGKDWMATVTDSIKKL